MEERKEEESIVETQSFDTVRERVKKMRKGVKRKEGRGMRSNE